MAVRASIVIVLVDARPTDRGLAFWLANIHTYKLKESNFDGEGGGRCGAVASIAIKLVW